MSTAVAGTRVPTPTVTFRFPTLGLPQGSPRPCQLKSVNHTFHWLRAAKDVKKGVKPATVSKGCELGVFASY